MNNRIERDSTYNQQRGINFKRAEGKH